MPAMKKNRSKPWFIGCVLALLLGIVLASVATAWFVRWSRSPLTVEHPITVTVKPGMGVNAVARVLADAGLGESPWLWWALFRWKDPGQVIHAGAYDITMQATPTAVVAQLYRGAVRLEQVTVVEGWTFQQMRQALANAPRLVDDVAGEPEAALMAKLGAPKVPAEGRFFPDTYRYAAQSEQSAVWLQAHKAMQRALDAAWAAYLAQPLARAKGTLRTPDDLLILASIIEKETQVAADRAMVSAVFHNRLRIGMRLQTDPTVIYGLGSDFDGNLRRHHLREDTPYNTYTRPGFPPTPIALPGRAALEAAAQPADSNALYFVARGDGSSQFSETLAQHNAAVRRYQLGQQ